MMDVGIVSFITQMLHGTGIFTYILLKCMVNVRQLFHTWSIWVIVPSKIVLECFEIRCLTSFRN